MPLRVHRKTNAVKNNCSSHSSEKEPVGVCERKSAGARAREREICVCVCVLELYGSACASSMRVCLFICAC